MIAANQSAFRRDEREVDEAIEHANKTKLLWVAYNEIEKIRKWNEQQLPAGLRKQAG